MYRYGDIVAKGEVVQHVDREEKEDIRYPADYRHRGNFQRPWTIRRGDVGRQRKEEGDEELDEGYEKAWKRSADPSFIGKTPYRSPVLLWWTIVSKHRSRPASRTHFIIVSKANT